MPGILQLLQRDGSVRMLVMVLQAGQIVYRVTI